MEALFSHLNLVIWLNDMLGYAKDADTLIATLKSVLTICSEKVLKLNLRKCDLLATKVQFCGRMIDFKGLTFHPRHYEALTSMEAPTTVGALMELVHGANWMETALPRFSELAEPLHDLLEAHYSLHNPRKKPRVCNRPLSAWGDEHQAAFTSLVQAITHQVTLATSNPVKHLCLFTYASSTHWVAC